MNLSGRNSNRDIKLLKQELGRVSKNGVGCRQKVLSFVMKPLRPLPLRSFVVKHPCWEALLGRLKVDLQNHLEVGLFIHLYPVKIVR